MLKQSLFIAGFALIVGTLSVTQAGEATTGFINKIYKGKDGEVKYVDFVPKSYKADTEMPVILFLHGAGESGTDGLKQVKVGLVPCPS